MATIVGVLAPLVGLPLGMITLYLRTIRDQQTTKHYEMLQRIECLENSIRGLSHLVNTFERDYTTKEEWLRESMHARRQLEHLTEMVGKLQVSVEHSGDLAAEFLKAVERK
jgi:archaellum component FlaC